jgi:hypothetical protein
MRRLAHLADRPLYYVALTAAIGWLLFATAEGRASADFLAAANDPMRNDAAVLTIPSASSESHPPNLVTLDSVAPQIPAATALTDQPEAAQGKLQLIGRWPFGSAKAVAFDAVRQVAFLGGGGGVFVLDVLNPLNPNKVSEISTPGLVNDLVLDNNLLYVANGSGGLRVFDVSDVTAPSELGSFFPIGGTQGVAVESGLAYISDDVAGLSIVNVTNPGTLVAVGELQNLPRASRVVVSGSHAYVLGVGRVFIVDVSNPAAPVLASDLQIFDVTDIAVSAQRLYASLSGFSPVKILSIFDVTDPTSPTLLGSLNGTRGFDAIAVQGTVAFALSFDTLKVVDVSNPAVPAELASFVVTPGLIRPLVSGSRLYVAAGRGNGLRILDVSNPLLPSELSSFRTPDSAFGVTVVGTRAYVANAGGGLRILDVANPATPREVGSFPAQFASQVVIRGSLAYVADATQGLLVIDVSDPAAPNLVGQLPGGLFCLDVQGAFAYVGSLFTGPGFSVVDVSNPASPTLVGSFNANPLAIKVAGSVVYVANRTELKVLDVSNPAAITEIGLVAGTGFAAGLSLIGSRIYVGSQIDVLAVDVSNPAAPKLQGKFISGDNFGSSPAGITGKGSLLYLYRVDSGFRVLDTRNPRAMVEVDAAAGLARVTAIDFNNRFLYTADSEAGVSILAHTGSLQVNLNPQQANSLGARWKIPGKPFQDSGQIITGLFPGKYSVRFKKVRGLTAPATRKIAIGFGQEKKIKARYRF